ncbi:MAG: hypothetical protein ABJZ69_01300, partial [Hyphomicrobiales bacterium]
DVKATESKPRSKNSRGNRRSRKTESADQDRNNNETKMVNASADRGEKPASKAQNERPQRSRDSSRRKQTANDNVPFAEADHVPAFLLRSVTIS